MGSQRHTFTTVPCMLTCMRLTPTDASPLPTAEVMLEGEVREAVISTAGTAAGAGAFGVLLTAILPTTVEDLLAMSLAAMVSKNRVAQSEAGLRGPWPGRGLGCRREAPVRAGGLLHPLAPSPTTSFSPPCQVGYVSILNLPMRRAEAKRKLEASTGAFAQVG